MPGTDIVQPPRRLDYAPDTGVAEQSIAGNLPSHAGVLHGVDLVWSQPERQPTD